MSACWFKQCNLNHFEHLEVGTYRPSCLEWGFFSRESLLQCPIPIAKVLTHWGRPWCFPAHCWPGFMCTTRDGWGAQRTPSSLWWYCSTTPKLCVGDWTFEESLRLSCLWYLHRVLDSHICSIRTEPQSYIIGIWYLVFPAVSHLFRMHFTCWLLCRSSQLTVYNVIQWGLPFVPLPPYYFDTLCLIWVLVEHLGTCAKFLTHLETQQWILMSLKNVFIIKLAFQAYME